jgi:hypothetical protein
MLERAANAVGPAIERTVPRIATTLREAVADECAAAVGSTEIADSFAASSTGDTVSVLSNHEAAGVLDQGGTVEPRSAQMLAIPLSAAAKSRGGPSSWPDKSLAMVRTGMDKLLLIKAGAKPAVPHYLLKDKVELGGHRYLAKALEATIGSAVSAVADEVIAGVAGGLHG